MEQFNDLINANQNKITEQESKQYSLVSFAFVGDAVHTLFVRTYLTSKTTALVNRLHTKTSKIVKASAQAKIWDYVAEVLTEEEETIGRRARNSGMNTKAKNAKIEDYKKATSFEAVLGYLYLTGKNNRLLEILEKTTEIMESL